MNKIIFFTLLLFLVSAGIAQAQQMTTPPETASAESGIRLNVPIGTQTKVNDFSEYVKLWYNFVLGTVGIVAAVMIMWGGFKWLTSRGESEAIKDAKERIIAAITGLVLAFLSYTILFLVNPNLVNLSMPELSKGDSFQLQGPKPDLSSVRMYGADGEARINERDRAKAQAACEQYCAGKKQIVASFLPVSNDPGNSNWDCVCIDQPILDNREPTNENWKQDCEAAGGTFNSTNNDCVINGQNASQACANTGWVWDYSGKYGCVKPTSNQPDWRNTCANTGSGRVVVTSGSYDCLFETENGSSSFMAVCFQSGGIWDFSGQNGCVIPGR